MVKSMTIKDVIKTLEPSIGYNDGNLVFNLDNLPKALKVLQDAIQCGEDKIILNIRRIERSCVETDDDMLVIGLETEDP